MLASSLPMIVLRIDDFAATATLLGSIASLFNRSIVLRQISGALSLNSAKRG
jgi:hypothetical protein